MSDEPRDDATVDRLRRLIVEELDVELGVQEIGADTPLFDDGLRLDSFAVVELIILIERTFDFEFSEQDLRPESFADLRTLARVVTESASGDSS